jgi:hypothetical protein
MLTAIRGSNCHRKPPVLDPRMDGDISEGEIPEDSAAAQIEH